ncbi:hypothetical protein RchiOBHm_Chr4g0429301 [Rosa chinensis]|uniref:Uncharacterized protein n=1 Tax=Rosa chinensis TaxID=74649 RepID=A0A2P6R057_ROSCH|nr:hypothetical protein RchiOBHm_Chr4g0429301 [Rosa chinensis]
MWFMLVTNLMIPHQGIHRNILHRLIFFHRSSRGFRTLMSFMALLRLSHRINTINAIRITSMKATRRRIQLSPTTANITRTTHMTMTVAALLSSIPVWPHSAAAAFWSAAACGDSTL